MHHTSRFDFTGLSTFAAMNDGDRHDYELMQRMTQWQMLMQEERNAGLEPHGPAARWLHV